MAKKETFLYKDAVQEIEQIIYKLENEEIDLDDLSEKVKRASELITKCKDKLKNTESEIDKIIHKMEPEK